MKVRPSPLFLLGVLAIFNVAGLQSQTDVFDAIAESHELAGMSVATRCGESLQMEAHVGLRDID